MCSDEDSSVPELILSKGFSSETHRVTTADGYVLTVYRITSTRETIGNPVVVWHGLFFSSRDFLINDDDGKQVDSNSKTGHNLAFELSKRGYDVWLPNTRGTKFSLSHNKFHSGDPRFWSFSIDEMIKYDLPTVIDVIINETNSGKVAFIGQSQASQAMFGLLSTQAKYNDMVVPFIAISPVAAFVEVTSPAVNIFNVANAMFDDVSQYHTPIFPDYEHSNVQSVYKRQEYDKLKTTLALYTIGFSKESTNMSRMNVYSAGFPSSTSTKNIVHLLQSLRTGTFQMFDYGISWNLAKYGQSSPPEYNISRITNRHIVLISCTRDWLVPPATVEYIRNHIGTKILDDYVVPLLDFHHPDFLFGLRNGQYVNQHILDVLAPYDAANERKTRLILCSYSFTPFPCTGLLLFITFLGFRGLILS